MSGLLREQPELSRLLSQLCDDSIDDAGRERLEQILSASAEARRLYIAYIDLHEELRAPASGGPGMVEAAVPVAHRRGSPTRRRIPRVSLAIAALVAAAATVAIVLMVSERLSPPRFASFVGSEEAVFALDSIVNDATEPGTPLSAGRIALESGSVELAMQSGATVTLSGHCEFDLAGPNAGRLARGTLHAVVPPQAVGFTLDGPPGVRIVDLGTEFEVDVDETGAVTVEVLAGMVQLSPGPGRATQRLVIGDAVRVTERGLTPVGEASMPAPGIGSITGQIKVVAGPPSLMRGEFIDAEYVSLFAEARGVSAPSTAVSFAEPGRHRRFTNASVELPAQVVDSFLLHLDAPAGHESDLRGAITFDRPVVGVIARRTVLAATDALFGLPQTRYPTRERGERGMEAPDWLELSEDRRTLRFRLHSSTHLDQIRVLVSSDPPE